MRTSRQEQWLRVAVDLSGVECEKVYVASGKKGSVRREIKAVSGMRVTIVQNRHQKARQPLSHQHQEAEVRREKATSEAKASLGSSIDSRANTSWKVLARNRLVSIGIFPNVNSIKTESGCKFGRKLISALEV